MARGSAILGGALLGVCLLPAAGPGRAAGVDCRLWASDTGNDAASGTISAPYRSIGTLVAGLHAGQTGCLTPGSRFDEHLVVTRGGRRGAPIRIRTAPGTRAVLNGIVRVLPEGHDVTFEYLRIQGDGAEGGAIVSIRASRVALVRDNVSGPGYRNAEVACVRVRGGAVGVRVQNSEIHDCTRSSTRRLNAPGIVVADAVGTRILDNFVYHTLGNGIVLAPHAVGSRVAHNFLDGNVSGVLIGGSRQQVSTGNVVADNILSYSGRWNVHTSWLGRVGRGNVVTRNCLWKGFAGNVVGSGLAVHDNVVASPRYVDRSRGFSIRPGGPCFSKRPRSFPPGAAARPAAPRRLGRFTVHYRLRALPARVQVVELTFSGLQPGAALELRCRSCNVVEHLVARPDGTAASAALRGRWLGRGGVVEARETRPHFVAATARIVVTGLPRGVVVHHGSG